MKKFIFKLESLLNFRRKREELVIQELAEAQNAEMRIFAKIVDTKKTIAALVEDSKNYKKTSIQIDSLIISRNYIELLKKQLAALEADLEKAKEKVLKVKEKLAEAVRERKIIEKLRESQFAAYKKEYNKQDNLQMDEIANNKPRGE
jgi:flagellar FliJ protein